MRKLPVIILAFLLVALGAHSYQQALTMKELEALLIQSVAAHERLNGPYFSATFIGAGLHPEERTPEQRIGAVVASVMSVAQLSADFCR